MGFANTTSVGRHGEDVAVGFLQKRGFVIAARNFQNAQGRKIGEIDIVAMRGQGKQRAVHFVEVKTRLVSTDAIPPESNITPAKLRTLHRIAQIYISANNLWDIKQHFDAVTVVLDMSTRRAHIKYLPDIFY